MDKFAENIKNLVAAVIEYAWLLPIIGGLAIGVALGIPSDATKEFAKKHWWQVILGTIIVAGAIYIGDWFYQKISF